MAYSDASLKKALNGHNSVTASFPPSGKLVASGNVNGTVGLLNMNDRDDNCLALSPHVHCYEEDDDDNDDATDAYVHSVAFTPIGQNLASGGDDGDIFYLGMLDSSCEAHRNTF